MGEDLRVINLGFVNAFLAKTEDGFILVDTGVPQKWKQLEKVLISAGCLPDKLKLVLITHGDYDHTGNCAVLQSRYHAKIAMHSWDAPMVETGQSSERMIRSTFMRTIMNFVKIMGKVNKSDSPFKKFKPDILLKDGQDLKEYGWDAKVVYCPGHTKGSIAVLTCDGCLIAGDTLTNMFKPDAATIIENMDEVKKSLETLKSLPCKMIYPGHGKPFSAEILPKFHF
jgi:glyoxylase-like metal-dependent hydrolase (beta-lactamase superfamily II)